MNVKKALIVAAIAIGATGAAIAASDGERDERQERVEIRHHGGPGAHLSVEHAAMHNIMAELLSAKTGKTTAEIQALFEKGGPHEAFEQLGLDEEDVRPLFKQAHQTLIDRSQKAGLITAAQAEKLRSAKFEMRMKRHRMHGDDGDRRGPRDDNDD